MGAMTHSRCLHAEPAPPRLYVFFACSPIRRVRAAQLMILKCQNSLQNPSPAPQYNIILQFASCLGDAGMVEKATFSAGLLLKRSFIPITFLSRLFHRIA